MMMKKNKSQKYHNTLVILSVTLTALITTNLLLPLTFAQPVIITEIVNATYRIQGNKDMIKASSGKIISAITNQILNQTLSGPAAPPASSTSTNITTAAHRALISPRLVLLNNTAANNSRPTVATVETVKSVIENEVTNATKTAISSMSNAESLNIGPVTILKCKFGPTFSDWSCGLG
jgi:hypothetical protein